LLEGADRRCPPWLGWWLAQTVTVKQVLEAAVVVAGLSVFIIFGDPAGPEPDSNPRGDT
jgi:hypothetical protein